jgi:hypothetical protein
VLGERVSHRAAHMGEPLPVSHKLARRVVQRVYDLERDSLLRVGARIGRCRQRDGRLDLGSLAALDDFAEDGGLAGPLDICRWSGMGEPFVGLPGDDLVDLLGGASGWREQRDCFAN